MVIAFAPFALIRLLPNAGPPGRVIVEVLAIITVQALRVVRALAFAMDHVWQLCRMGRFIANWDTSLGMAIAGARATYNQLVDGVPTNWEKLGN